MTAEIDKSRYDEDGFVVVRQWLSPGEFAELRDHVDRYIREVVPGLPDADAFYEDRSRPETLKQLQRMEQDSFFADYRHHPAWKAIAEGLLGEPAHADGVEWFNKPIGTHHVTPPHQDNFYFCLRPPQVLTVWLALDPVDEENGCLRYVRGSQRRGIRPHRRTSTLGFSQEVADYGDADRADEVAVPLQPGDVVIHHGDTIHRADANRSATRHRRSFAMVFKGLSCRRDEAAYARYLEAAKTLRQEMGLKS
ncbi:phytanoyl-CoA dioxygenase family protein [Singulisphaera sp. Ch08]|uniref:Phytanoyl-CoA dioxygenase family protein n=1 Tax=Singulisphaera sp. Ch08 TaxID=3120278 RepID=A0AAU7CL60_9BACT